MSTLVCQGLMTAVWGEKKRESIETGNRQPKRNDRPIFNDPRFLLEVPGMAEETSLKKGRSLSLCLLSFGMTSAFFVKLSFRSFLFEVCVDLLLGFPVFFFTPDGLQLNIDC